MLTLVRNRRAELVNGRNRLSVESTGRERGPTFVIGATLGGVPSRAIISSASGWALRLIDKRDLAAAAQTRRVRMHGVHRGALFKWSFNWICVYIRIKGLKLAYSLLRLLSTACVATLPCGGRVALAYAR